MIAILDMGCVASSSMRRRLMWMYPNIPYFSISLSMISLIDVWLPVKNQSNSVSLDNFALVFVFAMASSNPVNYAWYGEVSSAAPTLTLRTIGLVRLCQP